MINFKLFCAHGPTEHCIEVDESQVELSHDDIPVRTLEQMILFIWSDSIIPHNVA
jgi:hypothetical protein